jgi:mono/diheme cytochrome c family protein
VAGRERNRVERRRRIGAALLTVLAAVLAPAAGSAGATKPRETVPAQQEPDTSKITPAMVDAGRAIFHGKGTCFACHGMNLEGTQVAPTLKAHAWRDAKKGEFAAIFYVATHGVPGTLMVAFPNGISRAEALNVASYVWSVGQGRAKP